MNGAPQRRARIDELYLEYLRSRPCDFCCAPPRSDPSHLCSRGWREPRRDDRAAISHCRRCHNEWHQLGPDETMRRHGITAIGLACIVADAITAYESASGVESPL